MQIDARTARLLFWTGSRLLRVLGLCGALILALLLLSQRQSAWTSDGLARTWAEDSDYLDLAIAREIAAGHGYALDDAEGLPAQAHTLWRMLVGQIARFTGDAGSAAQALSLLSALGLLAVLHRALRASTGSSIAAAAGAFAVAASPVFLHLAHGCGPGALLALLLGLALHLHLRGLHEEGRPLPAGAALAVGAAALLRPEAAAMWLVFALHAALDNAVERRGRERLELCLWNAVAGLLMIALCLWPLINFNARHLGNPWPTALAGGEALGLADAWRHLVADFPIASPVTFLVALAGCAALLAVPSPRQGFRFAVLPLAALIVPPVCALASAFLEVGGPRALGAALGPLLLAYGAAGLVRAVQHLAGARGHAAAGGTAAALVALIALLGVQAAGGETTLRREASSRRADVARALDLDRGAPDGPVATDAPGWLRWQHPALRVLDLSGRASITALRCQSLTGALDTARVRLWLTRDEAAALVLWEPAREVLLDRLDSLPWTARWQSDDGWPRTRRR